jgi:hypothetical protein
MTTKIRTYCTVVSTHFGEKWTKQITDMSMGHEDDSFAFEQFMDAVEASG